jgi:hypothetical protein
VGARLRLQFALRVFHPGDDIPRRVMPFETASEVIEAIPAALKEHPGCDRIEVYAGHTKLFSVDCHGNTRPE